MNLRSWVRTPGLTAAILVCSASGVLVATMGINFSFGMLSPRLPYPAADRLVEIWQTGLRSAELAESEHLGRWASRSMIAGLAERTELFEAVLIYFDLFPLTIDGDPRSKLGVVASYDLPARLGFRPLLGRLFLPEEDRPGKGSVILVSHEWWRTRLGRDPEILDRRLTAPTGDAYTVVGVLDSASVFPPHRGAAFFLPLGSPAAEGLAADTLGVRALGVLRPEVSLERVARAASIIAQRHATEEREELRARRSTDRPYVTPSEPVRAHVGWFRGWAVTAEVWRTALFTLGLAVSVLAIATLNIASITLARTTARRREFAVRAALGAGARRLAGALLGEVTLIVLAGGVVGAAVGLYLLDVMRAGLGGTFATLVGPPDMRILVCALLATGVAGLAGAAWPALKVLRAPPGAGLGSGRISWTGVAGASGLGRVVALQVGFATLLCVSAAVCIASVMEFQGLDRGYEPTGVVYAAVHIDDGLTPTDRIATLEATLERVRSFPGVRRATVGAAPIRGSTPLSARLVETTGGRIPERMQWITPVMGDYLDVLRVPLLVGRDITLREAVAGTPVAVISRSLAESLWPEGDPLRRSFLFTTRNSGQVLLDVVGVSADMTVVESIPTDEIFVPFALLPSGPTTVLARVDGSASVAVRPMKSLLAESSGFVLEEVATLSAGLRRGARAQIVLGSLLFILAVVGLVLAAAGIYGVTRYTMSRRTHELGVRLALGASPRGILAFSLQEALWPLVGGILWGSLAGWAIGIVLESLTFGLHRVGPAVLAVVAGTVLAVGIAAALQPSVYAASTDPMVALRSE